VCAGWRPGCRAGFAGLADPGIGECRIVMIDHDHARADVGVGQLAKRCGDLRPEGSRQIDRIIRVAILDPGQSDGGLWSHDVLDLCDLGLLSPVVRIWSSFRRNGSGSAFHHFVGDVQHGVAFRDIAQDATFSRDRLGGQRDLPFLIAPQSHRGTQAQHDSRR
jgi:hypothetical protein